jgi:hypothetical protein
MHLELLLSTLDRLIAQGRFCNATASVACTKVESAHRSRVLT